MELTLTDTLYLVFSLTQTLQKDMCKSDRDAYESLLYRVKLSEKGLRIREAFATKEDIREVATDIVRNIWDEQKQRMDTHNR